MTMEGDTRAERIYPLGARFEEALRFAARAHRDQYRKRSDIPYVAHLLRVAGITLEFGADENVAIAALLHDVVEDQGGMEMAAVVRREFGDIVANLVLDCSDSTSAKGEEKADWRERKTRYLDRLRTASDQAVLISAADKLDNITSSVRSLKKQGEDFFQCFKTGKQGQQWYFDQLLEIYEARGVPFVDEIREKYNQVFA